MSKSSWKFKINWFILIYNRWSNHISLPPSPTLNGISKIRIQKSTQRATARNNWTIILGFLVSFSSFQFASARIIYKFCWAQHPPKIIKNSVFGAFVAIQIQCSRIISPFSKFAKYHEAWQPLHCQLQLKIWVVKCKCVEQNTIRMSHTLFNVSRVHLMFE